MNDYVVRYGNDNGYVERSDYMSKEQAERFYNKIELNTRTTWKELLYEPLEKEDAQEIISQQSMTWMEKNFADSVMTMKQMDC